MSPSLPAKSFIRPWLNTEVIDQFREIHFILIFSFWSKKLKIDYLGESQGAGGSSRLNLPPLHRKGAGVKCSENPQNLAARLSAISCYLGHESMIFQRQKFYLMLFYNSYFHNSFQKWLFKKYGNKSNPIQNT